MNAGILYLHGFRSSPASWKTRLLAAEMRARGQGERLFCPALSPVPDEAIAQAESLINHYPQQLTLVGSSLGGFYATALAEKHALRAVLINPAVIAAVPPDEFLGTQTPLHGGAPFEFTADHVAQLRALDPPTLCAERYLLLLETGDEVLDYRQAVNRYAGCRQVVLEGGNHGFAHFPEILPQLLEFCRL